jgi:hypothetical protein
VPAKRSIVGLKFGRLLVKERIAGQRGVPARARCVCDCGSEKTVDVLHMLSGRSQSCGCLRSEVSRANLKAAHIKNVTHGMSRSRTHEIWMHMRSRCLNPSSDPETWRRYGGRGIEVCSRWADFSCFLADMGEAPSGMSIDRINNDGNYEPGNCRWATVLEQVMNRSNTIYLDIDGERKTAAEWGELFGIPRKLIVDRLKRGETGIYALRPCGKRFANNNRRRLTSAHA